MPSYSSIMLQAKTVDLKANLMALRKGIKLYYFENGSYPAMLWHLSPEAVNQGQVTKAYIDLPPPQILPVNSFTETATSDNGFSVTACCSSAWCYNWDTGEVFVGRQILTDINDRLDADGVDICTY